MDKTCVRCRVPLEAGSLRAREAPMTVFVAKEFVFVRPGTPTSRNPLKALRQGMAGEPSDEVFPVTAWRCPQCGLLELCAGKARDAVETDTCWRDLQPLLDQGLGQVGDVS
jgi:hypothetical protein